LLLCLASCSKPDLASRPLEPLRAEPPERVPLSQNSPRWSLRLGGPGDDAMNGIAATREGALIVAGYTTGRFDAGCGSTVPYGAADVILVRLSPRGICEWQLRWGAGSGRAWATAVATGEDDAIYVTGAFTGTLPLGKTSLTSAGDTDGFVVKLSPDGAVVWARAFGGPEADQVSSVSVFGKIVAVGGSFRGAMGALTSAGGADGFYASLATSGQVMYAERVGGPEDDAVHAVVTDGARLVATGSFRGRATCRHGALASTGNGDVFVIADGQAKRYGSEGEEAALAVALAPDGSIVLGGHFDRAIDFGGGTLEGRGAFVARLGSYTYALGQGAVSALAVDGDTVYAGGDAPGPFLAKIDGLREDFVSTREGSVRGVAAAFGRVFATGWFMGTVDLGDRLHEAEGQDGFVVAR
jgi:hypothetical protein